MDDDHRVSHDPFTENGDVLDETFEQLLPIPDEDPVAPDQIDSPIDELLPIPGIEDVTPDDASTREELEVDTTADGIDDIIVLDGVDEHAVGDDDATTSWLDDNEPHDETEEPAVNADDDATTSWMDDNEPLNEASAFFAASQAEEIDEPAAVTDMDDLDQDEPASQDAVIGVGVCPGCAAQIGQVAYCPHCGTEQAPTTRIGAFLLPLIAWTKPLSARVTLLAGGVLVLLALLANSGAAALVIGSAIVPVIMVSRIAMEVRQQKRDHQVQILLMAFGGLVLGTIIAWLGARTVNNSWFSDGVLGFGAAGFGGVFADHAGSPPFIVWLMNGIVLPVLTILMIGALPYGLRIATGMAAKESSGVMLSAATAAGYVLASAIVFFRPMATDAAPMLGTSPWTLTIIGVAVIRPLVWIFAGAMIGAVLWRYIRTASIGSVLVPGSIAIALPLLYTLITLGTESVSLWLEVLVGLIFAGAAWFLYRRYLIAAMKQSQE